MRGPSALGSRNYPGKTLQLKPAGLQQAPILPRGRCNRRGDGKAMTNDNRRSEETPTFNHPGIYNDPLPLGRIEQSRQLCRAAERHA